MANKLTVLGSGISISSFYKKFDFRNPSGHLLQYNGKNILLDCGEGMRGQMDKIKFDYFDLDAIFISHFHPDHFNLDSLLQSFAVRAYYYQKVKKPLKIFGPPRIERTIEESINNKHYPHRDYFKHIYRKNLEIEFTEYKNAQPITIADITMTPFAVSHAGLEAFAMRFQLKDKVLAYSGDSADCKGLREAAHGAALFMCEAATGNQEDESPVHVSAKQVGKIATSSGAKHLVMVHYGGKNTPQEMISAAKDSGFSGQVDVAKDLDHFTL